MKKIWGAYLYLAQGFSPETHTNTQESEHFGIRLIGISPERKEEVLLIARKLTEEGASFLELCGGFGPLWIARIKEAIPFPIPVGGVFYGPEDREALVEMKRQ